MRARRSPTPESMAFRSWRQRPYSAIRRRSSGKTWSIPNVSNVGRDLGFRSEDARSCWSIQPGEQEMARRQSESSVRDRRTAKNVRHMPDEQLDYSDIPASTDEELKRARRVGRPATGRAKRLIAIRIDPELLARLRRLAAKRSKPYQTLIQELLAKAVKRVA